MQAVLDILSWASIISGGALCVIGAIGMLRLPDMFCRMHGASLIDTLGIGLILLGLGFQNGFNLGLGKLALIFLFVLFTSPTATHALARAAIYAGLDPAEGAKRKPRKAR